MLQHKQATVALRGKAQIHGVPVNRTRSVLVRSVLSEKLPVDPSPFVGDKVGKWLSTPFDLLAFPARASAGALASMPDLLQTLPNDVQRLVELVQDPRPVELKQDQLRKELESTVIEFLEKGVVVEQDVLSNLKTVLPPEAANALTELIPEPPNKQSQYGPVVPVDPEDLDPYTPAANPMTAPTITYGQSDVLSVQIASEITEIRNAVGGLKAALDGMRLNTDPSALGMLRLTLRDARDQLQRRLNEVAPATAPDPSVAAATREARILVEEVNAMFFT